MNTQINNPLHGLTLQRIVELLLEDAGDFEKLALFLDMRCFTHQPSIKSALSFLRKTDWARLQTEQLFVKQQLHLPAQARTVAPLATQSAPSVKAKPASKPSVKAAGAPARSQAPRSAGEGKKPAPAQKVWTGWTTPTKKT